jgi:hypothetical protein
MQGAVRVKAVMAVSSVIVSALLAIDAQLILLALDRSCFFNGVTVGFE